MANAKIEIPICLRKQPLIFYTELNALEGQEVLTWMHQTKGPAFWLECDPVSQDLIGPNRGILLFANAVPIRYDIDTLKKHVLARALESDDRSEVCEPCTRLPFSTRQLNLIKEHPYTLAKDAEVTFVQEAERRKEEQLERDFNFSQWISLNEDDDMDGYNQLPLRDLFLGTVNNRRVSVRVRRQQPNPLWNMTTAFMLGAAIVRLF